MTDLETEAHSAADDSTLPERYRAPRLTAFENVMPLEWLGAVGEWLFSQRGRFTLGGGEGHGSFCYELAGVDELYPPLAELKLAIVERLDSAIEKVGVEPFDLELIECHATLYHHGSHHAPHKDVPDDVDLPECRLAWCLYLSTEPKMYSGGELEFPNGEAFAPTHNQLVFYDPRQKHSVRRVECWSADFLHGRWALSGWVHGR